MNPQLRYYFFIQVQTFHAINVHLHVLYIQNTYLSGHMFKLCIYSHHCYNLYFFNYLLVIASIPLLHNIITYAIIKYLHYYNNFAHDFVCAHHYHYRIKNLGLLVQLTEFSLYQYLIVNII